MCTFCAVSVQNQQYFVPVLISCNISSLCCFKFYQYIVHSLLLIIPFKRKNLYRQVSFLSRNAFGTDGWCLCNLSHQGHLGGDVVIVVGHEEVNAVVHFPPLILHCGGAPNIREKKCVTRFSAYIFSRFKPIWAPDKHAKLFSNLVMISPRYGIWSQRCLRGVQHITETTLWSIWSLRLQISKNLHGVRGVQHTPETNCTPRSQNRNLH